MKRNETSSVKWVQRNFSLKFSFNFHSFSFPDLRKILPNHHDAQTAHAVGALSRKEVHMWSLRHEFRHEKVHRLSYEEKSEKIALNFTFKFFNFCLHSTSNTEFIDVRFVKNDPVTSRNLNFTWKNFIQTASTTAPEPISSQTSTNVRIVRKSSCKWSDMTDMSRLGVVNNHHLRKQTKEILTRSIATFAPQHFSQASKNCEFTQKTHTTMNKSAKFAAKNWKIS